MQRFLFVVLAVVLAGCAAAPADRRADARDPAGKAPPAEYRSAFEDYRSFADQELANWRKANDQVGAAGARHGGHK